MSNVKDNVVQGMVQKLVDLLDPERIILFGSRARGTANLRSDVDLLVVIRAAQTEPRLQTFGRIYRALAGSGVAKDILLYSQPEVAQLALQKNHVVARALRDGIAVYERAA